MSRSIQVLGALGLVLTAAAVTPPTASAESCEYNASPAQFDDFYAPLWGCQQSRIDDMWSRFDLDKENWDGGFGYSAPCDHTTPLGRTFNALQVLAYSITNAPTCSTGDSNVGKWAYCFSGNAIDELDGACTGHGGARAHTDWGWQDNVTVLYMPFFYNETVVERAATIFHEARHAHGWCAHEGSCPDGGDGCDPSFDDGCVGFGSGDGKGANAYQVLWLNWFATTARPEWTNSTIRANAIDEGNRILLNRFGKDPCKLMNSDGFIFSTC